MNGRGRLDLGIKPVRNVKPKPQSAYLLRLVQIFKIPIGRDLCVYIPARRQADGRKRSSARLKSA